MCEKTLSAKSFWYLEVVIIIFVSDAKNTNFFLCFLWLTKLVVVNYEKLKKQLFTYSHYLQDWMLFVIWDEFEQNPHLFQTVDGENNIFSFMPLVSVIMTMITLLVNYIYIYPYNCKAPIDNAIIRNLLGLQHSWKRKASSKVEEF